MTHIAATLVAAMVTISGLLGYWEHSLRPVRREYFIAAAKEQSNSLDMMSPRASSISVSPIAMQRRDSGHEIARETWLSD
jgi:hypothetical protein